MPLLPHLFSSAWSSLTHWSSSLERHSILLTMHFLTGREWCGYSNASVPFYSVRPNDTQSGTKMDWLYGDQSSGIMLWLAWKLRQTLALLYILYCKSIDVAAQEGLQWAEDFIPVPFAVSQSTLISHHEKCFPRPQQNRPKSTSLDNASVGETFSTTSVNATSVVWAKKRNGTRFHCRIRNLVGACAVYHAIRRMRRARVISGPTYGRRARIPALFNGFRTVPR